MVDTLEDMIRQVRPYNEVDLVWGDDGKRLLVVRNEEGEIVSSTHEDVIVAEFQAWQQNKRHTGLVAYYRAKLESLEMQLEHVLMNQRLYQKNSADFLMRDIEDLKQLLETQQ